MSFSLLFKDELKGFYKSKVMIFLWAGLPLLTVLLHILTPDTGEDIPFTILSALLVSSIGGTLASAMLAVSIIHDKTVHAYDLFLIRPIKRWNLIISKFLAVYVCITIASILALILGIIIDYFVSGVTSEVILHGALESIVVSLSMMAIASAAGIVIGVISPSVLLGVILVIYGGNQISIIPIIPSIANMPNSVVFTIILGATITGVLLSIAIILFNKKQF